ncbi:MAG: hypothetical protein DRN30_03185 [Thermoplasmata archaeon]|nr:MAG: hypothetical protein DRN30_03185 [Thermoplasmata archaeon]
MASFENMDIEKIWAVVFPILLGIVTILMVWGAFSIHGCMMEKAFDRCLEKKLNNGELIIIEEQRLGELPRDKQ